MECGVRSGNAGGKLHRAFTTKKPVDSDPPGKAKAKKSAKQFGRNVNGVRDLDSTDGVLLAADLAAEIGLRNSQKDAKHFDATAKGLAVRTVLERLFEATHHDDSQFTTHANGSGLYGNRQEQSLVFSEIILNTPKSCIGPSFYRPENAKLEISFGFHSK